jgi:hypothetical protein
MMTFNHDWAAHPVLTSPGNPHDRKFLLTKCLFYAKISGSPGQMVVIITQFFVAG